MVTRRRLLVALSGSAFVLRAGSLGATATPLVVRDIAGRSHTPLAPGRGGTHVLFFITNDCPISNRYAPEIGRLIAEYGAKGVRSFLVYAHPTLQSDVVRAHLREYYPTTQVPAIVDLGFSLTAAVGANVTPEAAVYTTAGRAYRGRIDDWYAALGQARRSPTRPDLRLALDAVLAGRPVPQPETQAVGCYIERRTGEMW